MGLRNETISIKIALVLSMLTILTLKTTVHDGRNFVVWIILCKSFEAVWCRASVGHSRDDEQTDK